MQTQNQLLLVYYCIKYPVFDFHTLKTIKKTNDKTLKIC